MQLKRVIFPVLALAMSICAISHASESSFLRGRLNFVVDNQLNVQSLSAEAMEFGVQKEAIIGSHIIAQLPLSEHDSKKIHDRFAEARETQKSQVVHYWLGHNPVHPEILRYFHAVITPLYNAAGPAGFFVTVREVNLQGDE